MIKVVNKTFNYIFNFMKCPQCHHTIISNDGICPFCKHPLGAKHTPPIPKRNSFIESIIKEMLGLFVLSSNMDVQAIYTNWTFQLQKYSNSTLKKAIKETVKVYKYFPSLYEFLRACDSIEEIELKQLHFQLLSNEKFIQELINKCLLNPSVSKHFSRQERIHLIDSTEQIIQYFANENQEKIESAKKELAKNNFDIIIFIKTLLKDIRDEKTK